MINVQLFGIFLLGFAFIYFMIGLWAARSVTTLQNYFLANRNLSIFQLTFALIASQLGSGMILGTAYRAYHIGLWGILYTIGMSCGFMILGCGLASRMRSLNIATTAEIFETHYGSPKLKMFASALSVISLWGILIAQIIASKTLFAGLQITNPYLFICCWLFVICYTMLGGLHSIIMVDIAQVSFIITMFITALWYTLPKPLDIHHFFIIQAQSFDNNVSLASLAPALLIPTLFSLIEQDLAQKFFAAKNQTTATISAFCAGIFLILFSAIPLFFGMLAKTSQLVIPATANPLVTTLAFYCPQILFLLVMCGIIAAITSTANSLMCAISSNIMQDFKSYFHLQNNKLLLTKIISACIGISALIASFFMYGDIISILEESYRISVVCLLIPTLRAYFGKPTNAIPAWTSCFMGLAGYGIMHIVPISPIINDMIALGLSLTGYFIAQQIILHKK